jgi:hypothetical protein
MDTINFPRPSPASGTSVVGRASPSNATPTDLLEAYMRSAATASTSSAPSSPSKPSGLQTPKKRTSGDMLDNGSPQSPSLQTISPSRTLKRSSKSLMSLDNIPEKTASQRAQEAAGVTGPTTPTKTNDARINDASAGT